MPLQRVPRDARPRWFAQQCTRLQDLVRVLQGIDAAELEDARVELRLPENATSWEEQVVPIFLQAARHINIRMLPVRAVKEQLQYALRCAAEAGLFEFGRLNSGIAAPAWKHRDYSRLLHALGVVNKFTVRSGYEAWRDNVFLGSRTCGWSASFRAKSRYVAHQPCRPPNSKTA